MKKINDHIAAEIDECGNVTLYHTRTGPARFIVHLTKSDVGYIYFQSAASDSLEKQILINKKLTRINTLLKSNLQKNAYFIKCVNELLDSVIEFMVEE